MRTAVRARTRGRRRPRIAAAASPAPGGHRPGRPAARAGNRAAPPVRRRRHARPVPRGSTGCPRRGRGGRRGARRRGRRAGYAVEQFAAGRAGQRPQRQDRQIGRGAAEPAMLLQELRAGSGEQHHRSGQPGGDPLQHLQQRCARPVQVLHDHDHRPAGGGRRDEPGPGAGQLVRDGPRRLVVQRAVPHRDGRRGREGEADPVHLRRIEHGHQVGVQLLLGRTAALAERDATGVAEDLAQCPVGDPSPAARHRPRRTRVCGRWCRAAATISCTRRLLPIPAAPTTVTSRGRRLAAASSSRLSTVRSSSSRPTRAV